MDTSDGSALAAARLERNEPGVIVSFISPFRSERDFARGLFAPGDFMEIFVDAPLEA